MGLLADAQEGFALTLQKARTFVAMLRIRGDDLGVAKLPIHAKTLVRLILAVAQFQLQLQQYRHRHVRMAACPVLGLVEADRAVVQLCSVSALPHSGTERQFGRLALRHAISAVVPLLNLQAMTAEKRPWWQVMLLLLLRPSLNSCSNCMLLQPQWLVCTTSRRIQQFLTISD